MVVSSCGTRPGKCVYIYITIIPEATRLTPYCIGDPRQYWTNWVENPGQGKHLFLKMWGPIFAFSLGTGKFRNVSKSTSVYLWADHSGMRGFFGVQSLLPGPDTRFRLVSCRKTLKGPLDPLFTSFTFPAIEKGQLTEPLRRVRQWGQLGSSVSSSIYSMYSTYVSADRNVQNAGPEEISQMICTPVWLLWQLLGCTDSEFITLFKLNINIMWSWKEKQHVGLIQ